MTEQPRAPRPAGALIRTAAALYDSLLVFGIWVVSLTPLFALIGSALPGAVTWTIALLEAFVFYTWFWTRYGRTLGMQAWRLRVCDEQGQPPSFAAATIRFAVGVATLHPLGYLWTYVNPMRRTLADIASGTWTVRVFPDDSK